MAYQTLRQKAVFVRNGFLIFAVSAFTTASIASLAIAHIEKARLNAAADLALEDAPLDAIRQALGLPADATKPVVKRVSAVDDVGFDTQVAFVSAIIRSHVSDDMNTEELATRIVNESLRQDYDPIFVAAVIRAESRFRGGAVSYAGARGLMQIMPATGRYLSNSENVPWKGNATLHDAEANLRLGIAYLKQLEQKFKGNRERALIAYNWGPANVDNALRAGSRPPQECVQYARKIIAAHRKWTESFGGLALVRVDGEQKQIIG